MEQLNNWKYCEASTKAHPVAKIYLKYLQTINNIFLKEGAKTTPFKNEIGFNLDAIEEVKASSEKRLKRKTVDLVFCITKQQTVQKSKPKVGQKLKPQTVLTELKLNLKSKNNVNVEEKDISNKIAYSIELLTREIQIHNKYLLVIKDTLKPQTKNRLKRKLLNNPSYSVLSIDEFHKAYFC